MEAKMTEESYPKGDSTILEGQLGDRSDTLKQVLDRRAEETQKRLEDYYLRLATDAYDAEEESTNPTENQDLLYSAVTREVGELKDEAGILLKASLQLSSQADELETRLEETRKSHKSRRFLKRAPANSVIDLQESLSGHFARGLNWYKILLVCYIGSFVGVIIEIVWCLVRNGYIESRSGLVYGPFNLLYGAGAVALTLALYQYRNRSTIISFVGGFLVGSVLEYLCSWGQEMLFGSTSWDYSNVPFNINGRICLLYSIFWGILGVMWIKSIYPRMAKWILKISNRIGIIITWGLLVFFVVNSAVSLVAVDRWSERVYGVEAEGSLDELMDRRFPNERLERIFANMEFRETPVPLTE